MGRKVEFSVKKGRGKMTYTTLRSTRDIDGVDSSSGNDESEDGEMHGCRRESERIPIEYTCDGYSRP